MGKSAYKKFLKQERAKVKLKNKTKALLPKGQNVTDLNFKVKKIVIKGQLKDHEDNEVLSTRKLNIQEVLSRLSHYSGSVCTEAVGQLESLLKSGGPSFLSSHLSPIVNQLSKLLTSLHSHLRKAAIKLLATVLAQVDEGEWLVIRGVVVGYIVCGLSHIDPGVKADALLALDTCPSSVSAAVLLPPLLDLLSTSRPAGRALHTPLSSSPSAHRTAVLTRISSVLSSMHTPTSDKTDLPCDVEWKEGMRVPLTPSYTFSQTLSVSNPTSTTAPTQSLDLKEFTSLLVPLMIDSFSEIAPPPDGHEPVCTLSLEGAVLLGTVAKVLLQLFDLLSDQHSANGSWMKSKFGNQFVKAVIEKRFPYAEETSKKLRKKTLRGPTSHSSILRLNLTLSLLTLNLSHTSTWTPILRYLSDVFRGGAQVEEGKLLERCLSVGLAWSSVNSTSNLLSSLTRVNRSSPLYKEAFSVLCKMYLNGNVTRKELTDWLEGLIAEISSPDKPFYKDSLDFLIQAAPVTNLPSNFDLAFPAILDKAMKANEKGSLSEVGSLLYWVNDWGHGLLDRLAELVQNDIYIQSTKFHIVNLILHKSQRYPELGLSKMLKEHSFWRETEQVKLLL